MLSQGVLVIGKSLSVEPFSPRERDFGLTCISALVHEVSKYRGGQELARQAFDRFYPSFFPDLSRSDDRKLLIGRCGIDLVGFASLIIDGQSGEFIVFVDSKFRNQGYGSKLLNEIVAVALGCGTLSIHSFVSPGARSSKSALERAGFKADGLRMTREA